MPAKRRAPRRKGAANNRPPPLSLPEFAGGLLARRTKGLRKAVERVYACQAAEPESIHALRVACRRLEATLEFSGSLLRHTGWWSRMLRKLRKLAGPVRDCDIIARTLAADPAAAAVVKPLLARRRKKRAAKLGEQIQTLRHKQTLASRSKRLCAAPRLPRKHQADPSAAAAWFSKALREPSRAAQQQLAAAPATWTIAHALRLSLKRLRYGVEIALSAQSGRRIEQLLARLREWQDRLGAVCDAETSQSLLAALCEKISGKKVVGGKNSPGNKSSAKPAGKKSRSKKSAADLQLQELQPLRAELRERVTTEWKRLRRWLTPARRNQLRTALGQLSQS